MTESWNDILNHYNKLDKRTAGGYHFPLKHAELSSADIRSKIELEIEKKDLLKKEDAREKQNDIIYAVETLDHIIGRMLIDGVKTICYKCEYRYQCRLLIVSLAFKRGLNAELAKDNRYIIVDCY